VAIALSGGYAQASTADTAEGEQRLHSPGQRPGAAPGKSFSLADAPAASPDAKETAWSERLATSADQAQAAAAEPGGFDVSLIRESFAHMAEGSGRAAIDYFFSCFFIRYPEMRSMFPHSMQEHTKLVFKALDHIVSDIDSPGTLTPYLEQLGRDHRKFGIRDRHYELFLPVLIDTVRHFCGHYWTNGMQAAWEAMLGHAASVMKAAAKRDAEQRPPWWIGEIVQHDRRSLDLAVLTIKPDQPLRYTPGQYVAVQVPRWPRVWRNFSIANAPRENGLIDLHVRAVPGGMVSGSLVRGVRRGDTVLLGRPRGEMTAPPDPARDLLCIAGGTGLAPIKAIIEGVINATKPGDHPKIGLLYGARTEKDLYDLQDLQVLESAHPAFMVTPVVSDDPGFAGIKGTLPQVARRYANCQGKDIFISGPPAMVQATVSVLSDRAANDSIRHDPADAAR
jgi:NAD(P)H-flavin reductase/hemoglobin-like flavoprotein